MAVSKKDWKDLERQEKENERLQKEIDERVNRINKNLKKNPRYYDELKNK